ncbi:hypothetical protein GCM10017673_38770 [Streptosporangium violaceochromogenes]|nr:hypothetical protein GCM10017673_38770 [Streptosporangium violaceochromogenes]
MGIDLITREEWGARDPKGPYSRLASTRGVKVHYTGGSVDPGIVGDHDLCAQLVRAYQRQHMDGNGWIDLGYSMVACPHRRVFQGRGPRHVPAANGAGLNSAHYAVLALVGNKGFTRPNDDLLWGVLDAVAYLRSRGGAGLELKGHRDGYSTDCPGGPLYAWVKRGCPAPAGHGEPAARDRHPSEDGRLLMYVQGRPLMRGPDVQEWQTTLRALGYPLAADGLYGEHTAATTRRFQRDAHLPVDGIAGPATRKLGAAKAGLHAALRRRH